MVWRLFGLEASKRTLQTRSVYYNEVWRVRLEGVPLAGLGTIRTLRSMYGHLKERKNFLRNFTTG